MSDFSVEAKDLSKFFRIFHEKRNSIYETVIGWANKKKNYEKLKVLDNISFSIQKGEMFGIIGKNGVGKTTLLRVIGGIYKPDNGTIKINGSLVPFLGLGAGFQIDLTARANVIQYGILLGFSKKEIESRVDNIIKFAELEKFADTKLKNFSTGMYARLGFATAIQVNPDILLIDEVLQVGDIDFQKKSFETILEYKKRGKTIILVTHDMTPIENYCDRAMFIEKGKIKFIGEPKLVVEKYRSSM